VPKLTRIQHKDCTCGFSIQLKGYCKPRNLRTDHFFHPLPEEAKDQNKCNFEPVKSETSPYAMKKPLLIFLLGMTVIAAIFFTLPINIFDGVILYENGIQELKVERPLSLSYFIGLGYDPADLVGVKTFYLTFKGLAMAFIFIIGMPALVAYRFHIKK
jgi:hypothetical protein